MKTTRVISSLAAIILAGGLLAACEEEAPQGNQQGLSGSNTSTASTRTTTASAPKALVAWPGVSRKAVIIAPVLTTSNFMIVYDGSGSMGDQSCGGSNDSKHTEGLSAVKEFVKAIPGDANIGLYVFDTKAEGVRVPLGSGNKARVIAELDGVRIGSGTPLGKATNVSFNSLTVQAQKQLGYGRYSMVIVTDGAAGDARLLSRVIDHVTSTSPVEIHTIGFCLGDRHTLNQKGKTFYASAQSRTDLLAGLKGVLAEAENVTPDDFK